jgi:heptosyltransferase-2
MKIAVFLPNWIGDVVMATPALRALRKHFHEAELIGVLRPYVAGVLEGAPWLQRTIFLSSRGPWSHRWPAVAWRLLREKIDLAVLFPNSFRSALVAGLGRCRRRIGFDRYARGCLLTTRLEPIRGGAGQLVPHPLIVDYNRLAEAAGCPGPGYQMQLFTTAPDEQAADDAWDRFHLSNHREVVCLNPGAAFGSSKYWRAESFAMLARDLVDHRACGVLVLCGPGERELARNIGRLANRAAVHTLADQPLSLGLTKACVRRATLLVTTDSGPRHFAAAFHRPVVTLFGPTHINWTDTFFPHAIHLQTQVECGPCQLRTCPLDHRCMTLITPRQVFGAVQDLLARRSQAALPMFSGRKAS